jgi:hypothetical protein
MVHRSWGFLSRAGLNDKSQLQRQLEKYAGGRGAHSHWRPHHSRCDLLQANTQKKPASATHRSQSLHSVAGLLPVFRRGRHPSSLSKPCPHCCPPDVYTSRVSNFMRYTPYAYFRWASTSGLG